MPRDPSQANTATLQVNEEQHVVGHQAAPAQHFDGEEIDAGQYRHMRLNEFLPARALASFWCRCDAMPLQHVAHGLVRNLIAEIGERTDDPGVAPAAILL